MLQTLRAFARIYRNSAAGRRGSAGDYTIDYEKFLRAAKLADGDAREIAERELRIAESQSAGLFRIDVHPRSADPLRLRLARDGGESWLFSHIGEESPAHARHTLADFFTRNSLITVPEPWRQPWTRWFTELARRALHGDSVQPFRRDDSHGNHALATALAGVLNWQGESLVRYASAAICGDSKQLQTLEPRLQTALREITGSSSLEDFGIFHKPRSLTFHGPLTLTLAGSSIDFSVFPAPVTLSTANFTTATHLTTSANSCLTVENEDTFHELAATNPGVLLILTSYPGTAVRLLVERLPADLAFHHFGDSDPAGADILRDLREKTGRNISPLLMTSHRAGKSPGQPLAGHELKTISRLLDGNPTEAERLHLQNLITTGDKGAFEQEHIPVQKVWAALANATPPQD
ncbi:MAG: Wadjet anti-phage system protein JetD domain-containing protein [Verrucomicrobiales bacterium]|nr:DUF2220 family protein [Verrucomicrobiota bacterium JB025]